jgi:hypothetical protein
MPRAAACHRESQARPEHLGGLAGHHYVEHVRVIGGCRDLRAQHDGGFVSQTHLVHQPEDIAVGASVAVVKRGPDITDSKKEERQRG